MVIPMATSVQGRQRDRKRTQTTRGPSISIMQCMLRYKTIFFLLITVFSFTGQTNPPLLLSDNHEIRDQRSSGAVVIGDFGGIGGVDKPLKRYHA